MNPLEVGTRVLISSLGVTGTITKVNIETVQHRESYSGSLKEDLRISNNLDYEVTYFDEEISDYSIAACSPHEIAEQLELPFSERPIDIFHAWLNDRRKK